MTLRRLTRKQLLRQRKDQALEAWSFRQMADIWVTASLLRDGPLYIGTLHHVYLMVKYNGGDWHHDVILGDDTLRLRLTDGYAVVPFERRIPL